MDKRFLFYLVAIASGAFGAFADGFLNHWAKKGGAWVNLAIGYLLWNIALLLFLYNLKSGTLAQVAILFLVANSAIVLGLSQFYFHEQLSLLRWVGITIAIIGVVVMELG